jgi:hypothetical protein
MNLIALMVVRNEAWCLNASLKAALQWCNSIVILDHASTDYTPDLIKKYSAENPGRIYRLEEHNPEWREAQYRQRVLEKGRELGGTHFAIIDADEFLTSRGEGLIRSSINSLPPSRGLLVPWLQCWRSINFYRSDPSTFGLAVVPIAFADHDGLEYRVDEDGYQTHKRIPMRRSDCQTVKWDRHKGEGVLHCQHAVWDRVVAKQKLYALCEMQQFGIVRGNYGPTTDEKGLETKDIPRNWWPVDPALLELKATAWQIKEVQRVQG